MFGWGISDFFASKASSKIGHYKVLFWSQLAGTVLMGLATLLFAGRFEFTLRLLLLIAVSGITDTLGYLLFYKGFEIGNVSIVSAVVNFQQVFIVAVSHFIFKQTLASFQVFGLVLLLLGITLTSINLRDLKRGSFSLVKGVKETFIATILFGALFWPLNEYVTEHADWIIVSLLTKVVALITLVIVAKFQSRSWRIEAPTKALKYTIAAVGVLEALAVLGVSFGVALGDSIIVGPIAGSLTAVTVSMAVIFQKEKITRTQGLGILLTLIGIVLIGF